jgi:hypothetical protein
MKTTVVGATVPAKALRAACVKAEVPSKDVRVVGARSWVELPTDGRDTLLARLAETLATGLMVIDVDVSGADAIQASRSTYRGVEEDVTEEARQLVEAGRLPPDASASGIAWALIGSDGTVGGGDEQWAQALFDKLIADGTVELRGTQRPTGLVAPILANSGRDLGDRLLATLIDSTAIDEVFADADQLAAAARATKPKR